ncbi:hypothetical protein RHSIM_Rhsim08G0245300 [Rhododendron simsii]|uniref:Nuclease associated modular domain-containing protein n=1 Tax=Rhododendron simsii TaxID=118357 RepID=A0A834LHE8_RHOSS|nr:hypothetical protein RHSIM_Rhsim08G0245300 [Rhododendron simsii]
MYSRLWPKPCCAINLNLAMRRRWPLYGGPSNFQVPRNGKNCNLGSNNAQRGVLLIQAVAPLEPKCLVQSNGGQDGRCSPQLGVGSGSASGIQNQSSSEDSEDLSEGEKLRRMRISKANKGLTPWNKGKKHSTETRQRIKERTQLAMQNHKVRDKLANRRHVQRILSKETRNKIGAGVQMGWERRREKLRLQKTCYFDWQNLIAEASRRGFVGQEELQWDSYQILSEQLEQEWLESIELKKRRRLKGNKRAPRTLEERRKISEAITAKWADPLCMPSVSNGAHLAPWRRGEGRRTFRASGSRGEALRRMPQRFFEYRDRVYTALTKYHGSRVGVERKPKKRPSVDRQARPPSAPKKKAEETAITFVSRPTFRKMFPEYVKKYKQQQLSDEPVPERHKSLFS